MSVDTPEQLLTRVDAAFMRQDVDAILECYENQALMVVHPGVLARGHTELRHAFTAILNGFAGKPDVRHEKLRILASGEVALFSSRWTLYDGEAAIMTRYATSVLRRDPSGRWKIAIDNAHGPGPLLEDPAPP